LVFHSNFLEQSLSRGHAFRQGIFMTQGVAAELRALVSLDFGAVEQLQATGVPPHVVIGKELKRARTALEELPRRMQAMLHQELEGRAADAGTLTRSVVEEIVQRVVSQATLVAREPAIVAPPVNQEVHEFRMWQDAGGFRRIPPEWPKFPTTITTKSLFQLYCLGDKSTGVGPYRLLESRDFVHGEQPFIRKQRSRISDMHRLMMPMRDELKAQGAWHDRPTVDQVEAMWNAACHVIHVPDTSPSGRKKRSRERAWTTHLNEFRARRVREAQGDPEDE
jgi:hypothetical protein